MPKREHSAINSPNDDINGNNNDDDDDGTTSEKDGKVTENDVDVDVDENQVDVDDDAADDDELDDDEENVEGTEEVEEEEDKEEECEEEDEDENEDEDSQQQQQSFVAWLEEGAAAVSIGEVHFSSGDYCTSRRQPNAADTDTEHEYEHEQENDNDHNYCVVYEMVTLPAIITTAAPDEDKEEDEETEYAVSSPIVVTFTNGNPFRILPVSACICIQLEPIVMAGKNNITTTTDSNTTDDATYDANDDNDDSVIYTTYSMNAAMHRGLLEELTNDISLSSSNENADQKLSSNDNDTPSVSILTRRNLCIDDEKVIEGVTAWWKAGEAKTGWDLQKIPATDYTTRNTVSWNDDNNNVTNNNNNVTNNNDNNNILLHLYRDLCAYQPFTLSDSRDTIEERFEWRTGLCVYFAWAVPNEQALSFLTMMKTPILEIGAGTGYWAMLLAKRGVDIVAYDMKESHNGHKHRFRHSMVRDGGVEQASKCSDTKEGDNNNNNNEHHGRALLLCWPDIVGDSASDDKDRGTFGVDCLQAYNGTMVIYIGELGPNVVCANTKEGWGDPFPPGGSSASEAFQTELRRKWRKTEQVQLPNWPPYNSHLTVWLRK